LQQDVGGFFGEGFGRETVEGVRPVDLLGALIEDCGLVVKTILEILGCGAGGDL